MRRLLRFLLFVIAGLLLSPLGSFYRVGIADVHRRVSRSAGASSKEEGSYVSSTCESYRQKEILDAQDASCIDLAEGPVLELPLATRSFKPAVGSEDFDEMDSYFVDHQDLIDLRKTALVLMDVWEKHPNRGFKERMRANIVQSLGPTLFFARSKGMRIVHAPHHGIISEFAIPRDGEVNLDVENIATTEKFDSLLKNKGIDTLIYAGYALNYCLLDRPEGIISMHRKGYRIFLLRDSTIAFESPRSLSELWSQKVTTTTFEHQWGRSTTFTDLREAFRWAKRLGSN